jgi:ubiquinone biosynthesis protein
MSEQIGWRALVRQVREEAPLWATVFPQLPRLLHRMLERQGAGDAESAALLREARRRNRLLATIAIALGILAVLLALG